MWMVLTAYFSICFLGQGAALLGAEAPKHSRIYDALNPKPLWFQTAQEKR